MEGYLDVQFRFRMPDKANELLKNKALEFVTQLEQSKFEAAADGFDMVMKNALPVQKLSDLWRQLSAAGDYLGKGIPRTEKIGIYTAVYVPCKWEHNAIELKVVFNSDARISGLWVMPPSK